jgi:murein DD-endopeptidase MepM/ murein hydrolase activator NlpD
VRSLAAALLLALPMSLPAADAPLAAVPPGSLVRWPGAGATRCLRDGVAIPPVGGECLFAIDLLRPQGPPTLSRERNGALESRTLAVGPSPYPVETIPLPDDPHVQVSPKNLARAEKERKALAAVFARRTPSSFTLPLSRPLAHGPAGRNFGRKRIFNGEERSPHGGTDYPVPAGTPVLAACDGVVALVGDQFFPGRIVVVDHGGGLFTSYIHLSKPLVKPGAAVRRGATIGLSGATGRVNGPHLHFGVRWQDARIDPEFLFRSPRDLPALSEDAP